MATVLPLRLVRYGGVSAAVAALAQLGLAVGYGVLRWGTTPSVVLSLLVSVWPAYWLNRRYVWGDRRSSSDQVVTFVALAAAGTVVAAVTTHLADSAGRLLTQDHRLLTVIVNATALLTTVVIWAVRFVAFDRLVFHDPRRSTT